MPSRRSENDVARALSIEIDGRYHVRKSGVPGRYSLPRRRREIKLKEPLGGWFAFTTF